VGLHRLSLLGKRGVSTGFASLSGYRKTVSTNTFTGLANTIEARGSVGKCGQEVIFKLPLSDDAHVKGATLAA
jgi:hypothetical protein